MQEFEPIRPNELHKMITENDDIINKELFKEHFGYDRLKKKLSITEGTPLNKIIANSIKNNIGELKKDAIKTPVDKFSIENPHKTVHAVRKILDFNKQNQEGQGLKILAPQQMLSSYQFL